MSNLPKEQKISSIESAQTVITEEPEKKDHYFLISQQ